MKDLKIAAKKEAAKVEKAQEKKTAEVQKASTTVDEILNPSADGRIKKLETLNRLAEKKTKIDRKLDELVNFNASNDCTLSRMEFTGDSSYRFTISNPVTIGKLLGQVEQELRQLKEQTEKEIIDFQI
ncbi:hypothetical protein VS868_11985 [Salinimicrobium sp. 3283s]|uniref:hypothetical protein n=1 Tax=Salinimicrobium sp. 3283s TaxID=3114359 RepID=UPI0031ED165F